MEPATIGTIAAAVDAGLKLPDLGRKLLAFVDDVKGPRVEIMVVSYRQVAQSAIRALGKERQGMLSDASNCQLREPSQVAALARRMRVYLHEDNVCEPLKQALAGLRACLPSLESAAKGLIFTNIDKQAEALDFMDTLQDLERQVGARESRFFPGFSGSGLGAIVPCTHGSTGSNGISGRTRAPARKLMCGNSSHWSTRRWGTAARATG